MSQLLIRSAAGVDLYACRQVEVSPDRETLDPSPLLFGQDPEARRHHLGPKGAMAIREPLVVTDHEDTIVGQDTG